MKKKELIIDFFVILFGAILFALGVAIFTAPNNIAPGGVTGISTLIRYVFHTPIGTVGLLLNVPLVIWAIVEIGYKLVIKTTFGILATSVLIDIIAMFAPAYTGNPILVSIFAGLFEGAGLGLIFTRGATTGGTDIVANILSRKKRHLSIGKLMLMLDAMVIVVSAFIFNSVESAMYACIVVFVATQVIDAILYGADVGNGKMFLIMSSKSQEIADKIFAELDRGATFLKSRGAYTGKENDILLCAVRRFEIHKIQEIIKSVDKEAFVIVGDAAEITGEGFKSTQSDDKTLKELLEKAKKRTET